jgi:hypothetical protein
VPPRINNEGQYTDTGTIDQDGKLVPYTQEEIDRTRAYEEAGGIPSTLPVDAAAAKEAADAAAAKEAADAAAAKEAADAAAAAANV